MRVNLYEQLVPWTELKNELDFDTHEQLAEFLINSYLSGRNTVIKWYVICFDSINDTLYALAAKSIFVIHVFVYYYFLYFLFTKTLVEENQ